MDLIKVTQRISLITLKTDAQALSVTKQVLHLKKENEYLIPKPESLVKFF